MRHDRLRAIAHTPYRLIRPLALADIVDVSLRRLLAEIRIRMLCK